MKKPPSQVHHAMELPFNATCVREVFTPAFPDADDPALPGWWAVLRGDSLLARAHAGGFVLPEGDQPAGLDPAVGAVFMGRWLGRPVRAGLLLPDRPVPDGLTPLVINIREKRLDDRLLTLGGMARQVLHWESRSLRCPVCAGRPARLPGGWGKRCPDCAGEFYPPIHPAVIVLVKRGREFLLARKPGWPAGTYSLLAGYLDLGESLEECVHREVREETGIEVREPRYVYSQNWPFPSQVMVGYVAEYASGEITVNRDELEDAAWFSPERMPPALTPPRSISRAIIDAYALGTSSP